MDALEGFLLAPTVASAGLYLTMVGGFLSGMRRRTTPSPIGRRPPISILKPLAGADDELAENLASFAALKYPDYEILLGVASREDAAYEIACDFLARFP